MTRRLPAGLGIAILWPGLLAAQPLQRFVFSRAQMGTRVTIVVAASDSLLAQSGADAAFARIDTLNQRLSDYLSGSELSRLSDHAGTGRLVPVSSDLWAVLAESQRIAAHTRGHFDVTIGPLTRLWRWATRRNRLPTDAERQDALASVGFRFLVLDSTRQAVRLVRQGMRLDLGGIAKGFAADEALKVLALHNLRYSLVDAGGDIAIGEAPPDSSGWPVSIEPVGTVWVAGCGVAASGAVYRHFDSKGVRYSHILDPRTGVGMTEQRTIAVVAPAAASADALASAASTMTPSELRSFAGRAGIVLCEASETQPVQTQRTCTQACGQGRIGIIAW